MEFCKVRYKVRYKWMAPISILCVCAVTLISGAGSKGGVFIKEPVVDLGAIPGDSVVTADFVLYNEGSEPVHIIKITSECECTVPYYTHAPIPPGDSARFEVRYDPAGYDRGEFHRGLFIHTSAHDGDLSAEITGVIAHE